MIPTTQARETLNAWTREMIAWHFSPETGCPFWLDYASKLDWDPRQDIRTYDDLDRFGFFEDEWLRGGAITSEQHAEVLAYLQRPVAA